MNRAWLSGWTGVVVTLTTGLSGCGGAARQGEVATSPAATGSESDSDPGFTRYAAEHGIETLNGGSGGGQAPEVTADGLRLEFVDKDKPVKLDGVPTEWPPFAKADVVVKGATRSAMMVGLQYDEAKLYVAAEIKDAAFAVGQDHVSLVLAVPLPAGGYATYDLSFFAGKPGESAGSVRYGRGGTVPGAAIVEAPDGPGYTFEATVPWSAIPEARSTKVGIHGVARYVEGDSAIATGPGDPQHPATMAWVPSEPELSMIEQLLAPKGLTKVAPTAELVADLTGDGMRERVAVFEHYLTICGPSYLGGTGFFFRDVSGEVVKLDARDATGRGRRDVLLQRRYSVGAATREVLEIFTIPSRTEEPRLTFAHEIEVRAAPNRIDNAIRVSRGEVEVSVEPATGWDAISYKEPLPSDVESILFPWGGIRSQTWRWDGTRFSKSHEITQKETMPPGAPPGATASVPVEHGGFQRPPEPPTPTVARGGSLSESLLDQYRRDQGVPAALNPKVDLKVQVAGDERPERVVLMGRDIVIFGPGFKGGTAYAFVTLAQFANAADISDLSARDLTGDGAADLVVRGSRHVSAGHPGETKVTSDLMFVYQVSEDSIERIFGIETGRELGSKRVQGLVQFIPAPGGKSFDVLAAPGRAWGWSEKTYPWTQESSGSDAGSGSIEPLLLPWGGVSSVRYRWNGTGFAKADE